MKSKMRKDFIFKRESIGKREVEAKSLIIKSKLFSIPQFTSSKNILFYVSFKNEVKTIEMIEECLNMGKRVVVPMVVPGEKELLLSEIKSLHELSPGSYGILEPIKQYVRPVCEDEVEVVVTPAVAFDEEGFRLGYGGGYYDRLMKKLSDFCITIGLAYEIQMVDKVPRESYDMKVDMIITEDRIITMNTVVI